MKHSTFNQSKKRENSGKDEGIKRRDNHQKHRDTQHKKAQGLIIQCELIDVEISKGSQLGKENYPPLIIHAQKRRALESIGLLTPK
jgi:hypothetical protein